MNNTTLHTRARRPAFKAPSKRRRLLAWAMIGVGFKLAIAAIVFAVAADQASASTRQFTPPDISQ